MTLFRRFMAVGINTLRKHNVCTIVEYSNPSNFKNTGENMKTMSFILTLFFTSQTIAGPKDKDFDLNLTEDQKAQMQVVKQNRQERMEAALEVIKEQAHAEMAEFLTAEQMQQVIERQESRETYRGTKKDRKMARKEARNAE